MNKKGFTLVELLGVIVLLAIILAIAVPTISNIIKESRRETFKKSVYSYVRAASLDKYFDEDLALYSVTDGESQPAVEIKGNIRKWDGVAKIYDSDLFEIIMTDGEFCATSGFESKNITITDGDCDMSALDLNEPLILLSSTTEDGDLLKSGKWTNKNIEIKGTVYLVNSTSVQSYQWYKGDTAIEGATTDRLAIKISDDETIDDEYKLKVKVGGKEYYSNVFNARIDKEDPTTSMVNAEASYSGSTATITFTMNGEDAASGIQKYTLYYKKSDETSYTSKTITTTATSTTTSITGSSGTTYNYYVVVYDNVNNTKQSTTSDITLKRYGESGDNCGYTYGSYSGVTTTGESSCTDVAETDTGTTYTTCTLDSNWTSLGSENVSSCTASETTTKKVECSGTKYSCGSWSSSTTPSATCSTGSAPACGSASQSYVSACSPKEYTCTCKGSAIKTYGATSCSSSGCASRFGTGYYLSSTATRTYNKTTKTRPKSTYKTKTTSVKYYTKVVYTRTKTANTCWY